MNKYGLIGFPLSQSFSKKFFTQKFADQQLHDCFYELYPLQKIDELSNLLTDPHLKGLNVTIPYKKEVISFLHTQDDVVKNIQACNCINIKDGQLTGYNTDVIGFEKSLTPLLKSHHTNALILGTGGSSAAVKYVLDQLQIKNKFVSRNKRDASTILYADIDEGWLQSHLLIINTTPLGMHPNVDFQPDISYEYLTEKHLLYDLVYNPAITSFLKKGEEHGAAIKNGEEMLLIQAEESWRIWNKG